MEEENKEIVNEWLEITKMIKEQLSKELADIPENIDQISKRLAARFLDDRLIVNGLTRPRKDEEEKA